MLRNFLKDSHVLQGTNYSQGRGWDEFASFGSKDQINGNMNKIFIPLKWESCYLNGTFISFIFSAMSRILFGQKNLGKLLMKQTITPCVLKEKGKIIN